VASSDSKFDIAIVMPTLNEAKFIGKTLEQVYMQDYPMDAVEVVVADGGSTDGTREIVRSFKNRFGSLQLLDNHPRRPSSGRNIGVRNSSAPYILILDGHTNLPGKTLLQDMVDIFKETGAKCLCRPQPLTPPDLGEFEKSVGLCRSSIFGHKPGSEIYSTVEGMVDPTSSGAMYHRSIFDEIGCFDEAFDACEDVDFNYRVHQAGIKAYISPRLRVFYYPRSNLAGLWRQMVRYGKGRFRFSHKHRLFSPVQWLAGAGVAGFVLLLLLSLVSSGAASLFKTVVGVYILAAVFFSAYLARKENHPGCLLFGPLIFPTIHFGLGFGFLSGLWDHYVKQHRPKPPNVDFDLT